jgi:hypothetical protein
MRSTRVTIARTALAEAPGLTGSGKERSRRRSLGQVHPPKRHADLPLRFAPRAQSRRPSSHFLVFNYRASIHLAPRGQSLSVSLLIQGEVSLERLFDDPVPRTPKSFSKAVELAGEVLWDVCRYDSIAHAKITLNQLQSLYIVEAIAVA